MLDLTNPNDERSLMLLHQIAQRGDSAVCYKPHGSAWHRRLLVLGLIEWTREDHGAWRPIQVTEKGWDVIARHPAPIVRHPHGLQRS